MQDARASRKDIHPIGKKNPNLPFHPAVARAISSSFQGRLRRMPTAT